MMARGRSGRPEAGEYAEYAHDDIAAVDGDDAVEALRSQERQTVALLAPLDNDAVSGLTYAPGKWTLKQVLGHLADDERIFAYRILCVARGDERPLPGFDENAYMRFAGFEARPLASVLGEYRAVRQATLALLEALEPDAWLRFGTVNGYRASVRGLAYHVAGHELRHLRSLRDKYLTGRG